MKQAFFSRFFEKIKESAFVFMEENNVYELEAANQKTQGLFENENNGADVWLKWVHEGTELATTHIAKTANVALSLISPHCGKCLNLNGCWFAESKMPNQPLHEKCHCGKTLIPPPISGITAIAESDLSKFTNYIFDSDPMKNKGKKALFESWGYDIMDSMWLQTEIVRQAQEKYAKGDYILGKLDMNGQRIAIEITILRNNGQAAIFNSGWMVYPNGIIKLTTPYGGKV